MSKLTEKRATQKVALSSASIDEQAGGKQAYVNEVQLSGHLTRDTEYQVTANGAELAKNALAVWQPYPKDVTMFLDIACFHNDDASKDGFNTPLLEQFLEGQKGQECVVRGRLSMREYEGKRYFSILLRDIALGALSSKK